MEKELLAPAGSMENLIAAAAAGADAVYGAGAYFGARAYADNFSGDSLLEALDYLHLHNKKFYLTVNTLLKPGEMGMLYDYLAPLYERGLDGVIIQDYGVLSYIKRQFPDLPLHASTQMTVTSAGSARLLKDQGICRIVPARELQLEEIAAIKQETGLEIETFVHGALCYAYSGQCLFSSFLGGRSGNRGKCAQTCRLPYRAFEYDRPVSDKDKPYLLSLKDLAAIEILPELIAAGISSFKIEGRMKGPEYTAGVVRIYRKYLDLIERLPAAKYKVAQNDILELQELFNRGGFCQGYYKASNGKHMVTLSQPNHTGVKAVKVKGSVRVDVRRGRSGQQRGLASAYQMQALVDITPGDVLKAGEKTYAVPERVYKKGESFSLELKGPGRQKPEYLYRTRNQVLHKALTDGYANTRIQEKINGKLILSKEKPAILSLYYGEIALQTVGENVAAAQNQPLSRERVRKQMNKTGGSSFFFDDLEIEMEEDVFMPMQSLNALRREAFAALEKELLRPYLRSLPEPEAAVSSARKEVRPETDWRPVLYAMAEKWHQLPGLLEAEAVKRIYIESCALDERYGDEKEILASLRADIDIEKWHSRGKELFLALPPIWRDRKKGGDWSEREYRWKHILEFPWDGVLVRTLDEIVFLQKCSSKLRIAADYQLYTFQEDARLFLDQYKIESDTIPLELNYKECMQRGCEGSELIAYGYLPMMVTAQCVRRTVTSCTGASGRSAAPGEMYLVDRMQQKCRVVNRCADCMNVIYNSRPLFLPDAEKEIEKLRPQALRLSFTGESPAEIQDIIRYFERYYIHRDKAKCPVERYTKGHFARGVK